MIKKLLLPSLLLFLCFCSPETKENLDKTDYIDRRAGLTREDFENGLSRDKNLQDKQIDLSDKSPSIPPMSKLLVSPPPPPIGNGELISFSITEDVPLKDALIELGRVADLDIEVDPAIDSGIILKVKDKPLKTIIERICILGGLRYSYNDGILRFEKDNPYTKNYTVDFMVDGDLWTPIESSMNKIIINNGGSGTISLNKPAGVITVYANDRVQKAIKEYIAEVRQNSSAQVLIEAKVVEVSLSDEFSAGIDWGWLEDSGASVASGTSANNASFDANSATGATLYLSDKLFGGSLTATVTAIQEFGTTRTLSSPRILSMNNQKATLEFTNSIIYFEIDIEEEEEEDDDGNVTSTTRTYTSTKQEEEEGVTLEITPSIDLNTEEITLDVIPTLKVQTGTVEDPALRLQLLENNDGEDVSDIRNLVPVIQTRTLETSLKIRSGDTMVIGGLMTEQSTNDEDGVPWLSEIPIIGQLFKSTTESSELVETVIFIKATIVDSSENGVGKEDRDFYNTYSTEKRRLF